MQHCTPRCTTPQVTASCCSVRGSTQSDQLVLDTKISSRFSPLAALQTVRHGDMSTDTDAESELELAGEALWPMSCSVRMRALLLELSFPAARPGGQGEDRGTGYNYGRKWTYLQGEYQTNENFSRKIFALYMEDFGCGN